MYVDARAAVALILVGLSKVPPIDRQCALAELDAAARAQQLGADDVSLDAWTTKYMRAVPVAD